jgi:hypothetical protein
MMNWAVMPNVSEAWRTELLDMVVLLEVGCGSEVSIANNTDKVYVQYLFSIIFVGGTSVYHTLYIGSDTPIHLYHFDFDTPDTPKIQKSKYLYL